MSASPAAQPLGQPPRPPHAPLAVVTVGMWLFLAALFMLFAASLLGYIVIRTGGQRSPAPGTLHQPALLWASTALVLAVSFAIARALHLIRLERQVPFRAWLTLSLALGAAFVLVQAPALAQLLSAHSAVRHQGLHLYGLIFSLVLLHALHVVGGIVSLARVTLRARRGGFDHENCLPVKHAAMYWHFLDAVWIAMFLTFWWMG